MANPDDVCAVCNKTRENHGDAHHVFDMENEFPRPIPKPEPVKAAAPPPRPMTEQIKAASFAALMEVLTEKGILDAKDVIKVFSAPPQ